MKLVWMTSALLLTAECGAQSLPTAVLQQLPKQLEVMTFASSDFDSDGRPDYVVVMHDKAEQELLSAGKDVPERPLFIFMQLSNEKFTQVARNDVVVYAIDQGGQCDPFMDGDDGLAVKGAFFTVQNSVACGQHWTDFITFKYAADKHDFFFHKRIYDNWIMNPSNDPSADALVSEKPVVTSANKTKPVRLSDYTPNP